MKTSFLETKSITEIVNDKSSLTILDVKDDIIAFLETSVIEPAFLTVGKFNSEAVNNGTIKRHEVSAITKILTADDFMYEPSEYYYDNDDEISK